MKKCFGQTEMQTEFPAFSSQSCPEVKVLIVAATAAKSFLNAKVEHLWDSSFSWKMVLITLCCH